MSALLLLFDDGPPFPRSLFASGEQGIWLDPSDFSTLFQDAAGTTPVTALGQPVGKILDKSGRGNHATQSTSERSKKIKKEREGKKARCCPAGESACLLLWTALRDCHGQTCPVFFLQAAQEPSQA